MKTTLCGFCIVAAMLMVMTGIASADDAKDDAIKKDRKQIEGTWRIVALEIDGNKAMDEDAKKLSVVNGPGETWRLFSEGKEVAKGTNSFDPTKKPKTVDFTLTEGGGKSVCIWAFMNSVRKHGSSALLLPARIDPPSSRPFPAASIFS